MKKSVIAFALFGILPLLSANAAVYRSSSSAGIKAGNAYKTTTSARKSSGYKNTITNNFYYNAQPYQSYRDNNSSYENSGDTPVISNTSKARKTVRQTSKTSQERKYFLAHPFFQPLKGKFGSVTDISYAQANMNMTLLNANIRDLDGASPTAGNTAQGLGFTTTLTAKETTSQFVVKEDLSYGLSDTLALMLMAQYDKTDMEIKDWSDGSTGTKTSTSGLNVFGIGLQSRFVDTEDYIAMISAYYQHQKNAANTFIGELKVGTKIDRTTLYGIARGYYSKLDNRGAYGAYMKEDNGDWLMLSYKLDTDEVFQVEGGVGVFSVFNKFVTGKAELTYGSFDWHNQLNIRGEIGFQPGDNFALNLYASTALYDSAKGKVNKYMNYDVNPGLADDIKDSLDNVIIDKNSNLLYTFGDYKIDKYNEWKIGVQGILYF